MLRRYLIAIAIWLPLVLIAFAIYSATDWAVAGGLAGIVVVGAIPLSYWARRGGPSAGDWSDLFE